MHIEKKIQKNKQPPSYIFKIREEYFIRVKCSVENFERFEKKKSLQVILTMKKHLEEFFVIIFQQ